MENNPELDPNSVYGGSMTPEQFMEAEFHVDKKFECFPDPELPIVEVTSNGQSLIKLTPMNSSVIRYDSEPTMYDHILVLGRTPTFWFYNEENKYVKIATAMLENDFPLLMHYKEPTAEVREAHYRALRGHSPLTDIIERILDE